jgi:3-oxoacyl-[acyl-carrier-protein] synthase III
MKTFINSIITGSGSYIPENIIPNSHFLDTEFYGPNHKKLESVNEEIIEKFEAITEIKERRWADAAIVNSDMGAIASKQAIEDAGISMEDIDYILTAHNFGDVKFGSNKTDIMPSIASKIKNKLGIENPKTIPYDVIYGCPGWIEAMRMGDQFIKAGLAKKILVVGTEMLSRIIDPYDRDQMIFADGAAAVILEAQESEEQYGIIHHNSVSHNNDELHFLFNGKSLNREHNQSEEYIRMQGRKIYEYALTNVPAMVKSLLDEAGVTLSEISKLLIHQANAKMDEAILKRIGRLYKTKVDKHFMPMTIQELGNSSVATVPTMLDLILKGKMENQNFNSKDLVIFASVGAGMTINSMLYKFK